MVDTDRLTKGFNIGTVLGTILVAPYNYSAEIYGFRYANPNPLATVMAELTSQSSGTITATIDEVVLTPGQPVVRDSLAERPLAVLQAGDALMGAVIVPTGAAGSIMGVIVYKWVPGRLKGQ
jgi:hypothetical protein